MLLPATLAVSQSRRSRFQTGISIQVGKQTSAMRDGYKNRHKARGTFIRLFFFLMRVSSLLDECVNQRCCVGQVAGWHQRLPLYDADKWDTLWELLSFYIATGFTSITYFSQVGKTRRFTDSRSFCDERERAERALRICEWWLQSLPRSPRTGPAWAGGLVLKIGDKAESWTKLHRCPVKVVWRKLKMYTHTHTQLGLLGYYIFILIQHRYFSLNRYQSNISTLYVIHTFMNYFVVCRAKGCMKWEYSASVVFPPAVF